MKEKDGSIQFAEYADRYSEESFWEKLAKYALAAGRELIEMVLTIYYCMLDKDTPEWAKAIIIGALGYFISPVDAVPDVVPVVGYTDDLAVLGAAFMAVAAHIKPEHKKKARKTMRTWFND
jgi:uncharacterized membrane protein YkvA (DUF1232 family)